MTGVQTCALPISIEKSKTERIDIGYQTNVTFIPANSGYSVDSTKRYFNYNHHYSLKSLYCYNYSLGLGDLSFLNCILKVLSSLKQNHFLL